jgi:hypothetical protein
LEFYCKLYMLTKIHRLILATKIRKGTQWLKLGLRLKKLYMEILAGMGELGSGNLFTGDMKRK